jgi:hypothetical protein
MALIRRRLLNGKSALRYQIKRQGRKRYHYDSHAQFEAHLKDFINAYNYARRLKTLVGLTLYEFIQKIWTKEPKRFKIEPVHQNPRLNI